ncbi:MAG: TRAP transporter small permease subunit [Gammaproteobacteria bacterium]|nr:TRAP transporter small permease subunit [Gammaproteobacteria bacterium]
MELPETPISRLVDPVLDRIGNAVSWIWVVLLAVIVCNVVLRYALAEGRIEFEEIQWHLYSVGFMLGLGYALQHDAHVRVDVLHERFRPTTQAWIDLYGIVLFLFPFIALMLIYGVPFVVDSFVTGEISSSPGGLPYRWAIKSVLVLGFALLGIAALSRLTRLWKFLFLGLRSGDAR